MESVYKGQTTFVVFLVIDAVRLLLLAQLTGLSRLKTKEFHAPEDARGNESATLTGEGGNQMTLPKRAMRAHYNAIENDFVWLLAFLAMSGANCSLNGIIVLSTFYQFFRICHAIFYMLGKQPFRAISFLGGALCCITMLFYAFIQVIVNRF